MKALIGVAFAFLAIGCGNQYKHKPGPSGPVITRDGEGNVINSTTPTSIEITCNGNIQNNYGKHDISKTFTWDGRTTDRFEISKGIVENAGMYYLDVHPEQVELGLPKRMSIFGWFIDNNKNQRIIGEIKSDITLIHNDKKLNNTQTKIKCVSNVKKETMALNKSNKLVCFGSYGKTNHAQRGAKYEPLVKSFELGSISRLNFVDYDGNQVQPQLSIFTQYYDGKIAPDLSITAEGQDGHVNMNGVIENGDYSKFEYLSAWDNRGISIECLRQSALEKSMLDFQKTLEKNEK